MATPQLPASPIYPSQKAAMQMLRDIENQGFRDFANSDNPCPMPSGHQRGYYFTAIPELNVVLVTVQATDSQAFIDHVIGYMQASLPPRWQVIVGSLDLFSFLNLGRNVLAIQTWG